MDDHCLTSTCLQRYVRSFGRGIISRDDFLDFYLERFDPDAAASDLSTFPKAAINGLLAIMADSPSSEEEWVELAKAHRLRAGELRSKLGDTEPSMGQSWFINDLDSDYRGLKRCAVYALRKALGLTCSEEPWQDWLSRHKPDAEELGLHPWFLQNRLHWYRFLDGGGFSPESANPFASNPGRGLDFAEYSKLHGGIWFAPVTIAQLQYRLDFIVSVHRTYFLNARRRHESRIEQRESDGRQAGLLRELLTAHRAAYPNLSVAVDEYDRPRLTGTVVSGRDIEDITDLVANEWLDPGYTRYPSTLLDIDVSP